VFQPIVLEVSNRRKLLLTRELREHFEPQVVASLKTRGFPAVPPCVLGDALIDIHIWSPSDIHRSLHGLTSHSHNWINERASVWRNELAYPLERRRTPLVSTAEIDLICALEGARTASLPEVVLLELIFASGCTFEVHQWSRLEVLCTTIGDLAAWGCLWAQDMVSDSYYHSMHCLTCAESTDGETLSSIGFTKPIRRVSDTLFGMYGVNASFRLVWDQFATS
jgi:hypothetical protein